MDEEPGPVYAKLVGISIVVRCSEPSEHMIMGGGPGVSTGLMHWPTLALSAGSSRPGTTLTRPSHSANTLL